MLRFGFLMAGAALGAGALGLILTAACLDRYEPGDGGDVVAVRLRIELNDPAPAASGIAGTDAPPWRPVALEADLRRDRDAGPRRPTDARRLLACGRSLLRVGLRLTVTLLHHGASRLAAAEA